MKKTIIAGAAASVLAAMPIAGVFAADYDFTDTVKVTITKSCTIVSDGDEGIEDGSVVTSRTLTGTVQPGSFIELGDTDNEVTSGGKSSLSIVCNADGTESGSDKWTLNAKAASADMTGNTTTNKIETGLDINGGTSSWAFKINVEGGSAVGNYGGYSIVPTSSTPIAEGTPENGEVSINPVYRIYAASDQPADTYTGTVTYTLTYPAN